MTCDIDGVCIQAHFNTPKPPVKMVKLAMGGGLYADGTTVIDAAVVYFILFSILIYAEC